MDISCTENCHIYDDFWKILKFSFLRFDVRLSWLKCFRFVSFEILVRYVRRISEWFLIFLGRWGQFWYIFRLTWPFWDHFLNHFEFFEQLMPRSSYFDILTSLSNELPRVWPRLLWATFDYFRLPSKSKFWLKLMFNMVFKGSSRPARIQKLILHCP